MNEPLTGYHLPNAEYTDCDVHLCILPEIWIIPDTSGPTQTLPVGTRWQCGDCKTVHQVAAVSLGRVWQIADTMTCGEPCEGTGLGVVCDLPPHGQQLLHESTRPDGQLRRW